VAVAHILTADQDQVLRVQAQQVAATYEFPEPHDRDYKEDMKDNQQRVDTSVGGQMAAARVWAEVFDTRGHILTRSSDLRPRHVPLPGPAATLVRAPPRLSTQAVPGDALHIYSLPARHEGHIVGVVVVGRRWQREPV
jgi:hypothetical protein